MGRPLTLRPGARRSRRFNVNPRPNFRSKWGIEKRKVEKPGYFSFIKTLPSHSTIPRRVLPNNVGLLELIRGKREYHWKPSTEELRKGFRGWHQRGYLPHFDAPYVTQMITFILADSFPIKRNAEWEAVLNEPDNSLKRRKLEGWLDRGHGQCYLCRPQVAKLVEQVLLDSNGVQFNMQAWCIMPNHVHLVVDVWDMPLVKMLNKWKGRTARLANKLLGRRGAFWQEDYFDTLIRSEEHLKKAIRYVEQNPAKAGFVKNPLDWQWSSARLRDEYLRLAPR
jgi:putative transposase